jgi:hypothetical protein
VYSPFLLMGRHANADDQIAESHMRRDEGRKHPRAP